MMVDLELKKTTGMLWAVLLLWGMLCFTAFPGQAYAAETVSIGVVDYGYLLHQHPDTQKANDALKAESEQVNKDFAAKAAGLSDKEKQELRLQLAQRVESKRQELLKGIADKINAAINEVAAEKQLTIVINKDSVSYGGLDITQDVLQKFR